MTVFQGNSVLSYESAIVADRAGQQITVKDTYEVPNTLGANDIVQLAVLPANHEIVDAIMWADDLDTGGPTITIQAAILNAAGTDILAGGEIIASAASASDIAQAGGMARCDQPTIFEVAATWQDRLIGIKIVAAATTPAVGTLGLQLSMRRAD